MSNTFTIESGYGIEFTCSTWEAAIACAERMVKSIKTTWIILHVRERASQDGNRLARPMVREQKVSCNFIDKN